MTIQIRGTTSAASVLSLSATLTPNFTPQAGDLLLMHVGLGSNRAVTAPEGWTLVDSELTGIACLVYQKRATASEPSSYTFQHAEPAVRFALGLIGLYSDSGNNPEIDVFDSRSNATASVRSWPSVTTTVNNTLLLCFATQSSGVRLTPQAGMTERWDYDSFVPMYMMSEAIPTAGATGEKTASAGSTASSRVITVAVKESSSQPQSVELSAISSSGTVHSPTVAPGPVVVTSGFIPQSSAVYALEVVVGSVALSPDTIGSASEVFSPSVQAGEVSVSLDSISSEEILYPVEVQVGSVQVIPNAIGSASLVYEPTFNQPSLQQIEPDAIAPSLQVYSLFIVRSLFSAMRTLVVKRENRSLVVEREVRTSTVRYENRTIQGG